MAVVYINGEDTGKLQLRHKSCVKSSRDIKELTATLLCFSTFTGKYEAIYFTPDSPSCHVQALRTFLSILVLLSNPVLTLPPFRSLPQVASLQHLKY